MERRDFLKVAATLPAMAAIPGLVGTAGASEVEISEKQARAICVFSSDVLRGGGFNPIRVESDPTSVALSVLYGNAFVLRYPELFNTEQTIPMPAPTVLSPTGEPIVARSRAYHAKDADGCMEELASFVRTWHTEGRIWFPYVPIDVAIPMSGGFYFKTRYGLSEI